MINSLRISSLKKTKIDVLNYFAKEVLSNEHWKQHLNHLLDQLLELIWLVHIMQGKLNDLQNYILAVFETLMVYVWKGNALLMIFHFIINIY